MVTRLNRTMAVIASLILMSGSAQALAAGQTPPAQKPPVAQPPPKPVPQSQAVAAPEVVPPADYVIGADDVLVIVFRREKDMSAEVAVRPDGKITLPLLNDVVAAGLTPDQLRARITDEAKRLVEEPSVTVIVKAINSRKVFITGEVGKPGSYPLGDRMTVMQLISMAGGVSEYARKKDIVIIRETGGRPGAKPLTFRFNYEDIQKLKNLASNIDLKPGDTVIVP